MNTPHNRYNDDSAQREPERVLTMPETNSIEERADWHYNEARHLSTAKKYQEAVAQLRLCLDLEPRHDEARLMLGEEYLLHSEHLGLSDEDGDAIAIGAFEQLLTENPRKTEAWVGLALARLYQDDYVGAIEAANKGFAVIGADTSFAMGSPAVFMNVAESLYDVKIRAYFGDDKADLAMAQLQEGLAFCPDSEFLSRHLDGRWQPA